MAKYFFECGEEVTELLIEKIITSENEGMAETLILYRSPECWGYAELERTWKYMTIWCISCRPYRSIRKQIWPYHKYGQGQPRVIIWKKKPQGMGIQPLGSSSGSIWKLLFFPSCCTSSRPIPFASLFYMIYLEAKISIQVTHSQFDFRFLLFCINVKCHS